MSKLLNMSRRQVVRAGLGAASVGAVGSLAAPRIARAATTLRFVATGAFPPYNMRSEDGQIIGIYADMLNAIGKATNLTIDYRPYPWVRAQKMVEDGEADGFVTIPNDARRKYVRFTNAPLVTADSPLLVTLKGSETANALKAAKSLEDLKKFRIGDYRGNSYGEGIHKEWTEKQIVTDIPSVLKILNGGRIDYTIQIKEIVQYYAKAEGLTGKLDYTPLEFLAQNIQYFHIGLRLSLPGVAELMGEIEKEQERLRADGALTKISELYIN